MKKHAAVVCLVAGVAGAAAGTWGLVGSGRPAPAGRASWITRTQRNAGPEFDFALAGERAIATIGAVQFAVDGSGLALTGPGARWDVVLRVQGVGRGSSVQPLVRGAVTAVGNVATVEHPSLAEQWLSGPLGMEQVLTLEERPVGTGELVIDVTIEGSLEAVDDGGRIAFRDSEGATVAAYSDVYVADASGTDVPVIVEAAGNRIRMRIDDSRAQYPLVIDPLIGVEQAHLFASDAAAGDRFGSSILFDGTTLVTAAPLDDTARGTDGGSVYVYVRNGSGGWTEQAHLIPSTGAVNDQFGGAFALSGDTLAVGAPRADVGATTDAGAVFVFVRSGTTWTEQARLTTSDAAGADRFGTSVAIEGNTVVAGAYFDDTAAGTNAGSAYVFTRTGSAWSETAHLFASDGGAANDLFGVAIALAGNTVVVGADAHDTAAGADAGAAYVYTGSGSTWSPQGVLTASDGASGDLFGVTVAIQNDTIAVAATERDTRGSSSGGVYIYDRVGTTWNETIRLLDSGAIPGDRVGASLNFDGTSLAAGASAVTGFGYVTIFRLSTTWSQVGHVVAADQLIADAFGFGADLSGETLIVGARNDDTAAGTDAGSVYEELLRSANGDPCTSGATCASGFCADGVCCNSACGGSANDCQACSVAAGAAVNGTCIPFSASTTCRPAVAGGCDRAETCDGVSGTCPADLVATASTPCRAAMGSCDVADTCDGISPLCADQRVPSGTECRAAGVNPTCDPAEVCDASNPDCPMDTSTDGTSCADGVTCNGTELCAAGSCQPGTALACDDGDACTADACAEPGGCMNSPVAGCCNIDADCDDGDGCTGDMCSGLGGTCSHVALPVCVDAGLEDASTVEDAAVPGDGGFGDAGVRDAGSRDAGRDASSDANVDANTDAGIEPLAPSAGCGCAAAGAPRGSAAAGLAILLGAGVVARRRRRSRR